MGDAAAQTFASYGRYYDLLYPDKDYSAEAAYVDGLLRAHGGAPQRLLEFGCGTGGHARRLIERGYQVEGVDRSEAMLQKARAIGGFTGHFGDACSVVLDSEFDAVLALFHVLNYQVDNPSVLSFFRNAARHTRVGGLFVFDTWYSPAVYAQGAERRVKTVRTDDVDLVRVAEPVSRVNENRIDVNYRIDAQEHHPAQSLTVHETHAMRHFSLPELDLFAQVTGFTRVAAQEFLTGAEPGLQSWGVAVVMKRM